MKRTLLIVFSGLSALCASDESIERLDPALDAVLTAEARIETLCRGFEWAEGPVWDRAENRLLFSDVPENTIYRWSPGDDEAVVWMKPSGYTGVAGDRPGRGSNGLAFDASGRLILCEHGDRRVSVLTEFGGKRTIADHYGGRRFNSPNDLVIHSSGAIYFTDPPYGLKRLKEGRELDFNGVFRIAPDGGVALITRELDRPNGIALSPDETILYVAQSHKPKPVIMAYPLKPDGLAGKGEVFFDASNLDGPGLPDGMKVRSDGTVFATGPGGLLIISPEGKLLGRILCGRPTANVALSPDEETLYLTADDRILKVYLGHEDGSGGQLPASLAVGTAARAFLASLDEPLRKKARHPFDSTDRVDWHYVPKTRTGLALKEMNEAQKNAAVGLVVSALSEKGAYKTAQIISLEGVLAALEGDPERRDQEKYYIAVFGDPGDPDGWGFRIEGHHLSLNLTFVGETSAAVTPSFMGANPAEVRDGDSAGMRPLQAEEDLARVLAAALKEAGNPEVLFSDKPPHEILSGTDRVATQLEPVGIQASDMSPSQQEGLFELIEEYAHRYRVDLAEAEMKAIRQLKLEEIRFGWAGSLERGEAFYYRIQSPTFLIEAANTQNDANHLHTVWRDFSGDFGRDLLKEHMKQHE